MSSISNITNAASTDAAAKVQPKKAPATAEAAVQPQVKAEAPARPMPGTSSFSATA